MNIHLNHRKSCNDIWSNDLTKYSSISFPVIFKKKGNTATTSKEEGWSF